MFFRKNYNLSKNEASETLKNVFAASNRTPNTTSFDMLILRGLAHTTMVTTCKWIATACVFLLLVAPVALINNDIKIESKGIASDTIIITDHRLYTDRFVLMLNGNNIEYDSIYARNKEGDVIFPSVIDKENSLIEFPYNNESLTVYIPNSSGHVLTATMSEYNPDKLRDSDK